MDETINQETAQGASQSEQARDNAWPMMQTASQTDKITEALALAQAEIAPPKRDRTVNVRTRAGDNYSFKYATFSAIIEAVLTKNGLWFVQTMRYNRDEQLTYLKTTLLHKSGQAIEMEVPLIISQDGIQAFGSGLTYMKRYCLSALLGVAADEDDDGNAAAGNEIQSMQENDRKPRAPAPDVISDPVKIRRAEALSELAESDAELIGNTSDFAPSRGRKPSITTQSPHDIPVPILADGSGSDWVTWGKTFIAAVRAAPTKEELDKWETHNTEPLANMKKASPGNHRNLMDAVNRASKEKFGDAE